MGVKNIDIHLPGSSHGSYEGPDLSRATLFQSPEIMREIMKLCNKKSLE